MKNDILFGKICKFCEEHLLLQYWYVIFWSCNFLIDVVKCVFVSVFFWCCCFMTFLFSAYVWNIMFEVHIFNSTSVFFSFVSTFIEIIDLLCDFLLFSFRVRSFKVIYIIVCLAVVDVVKLHIIWNYVPNKTYGLKKIDFFSFPIPHCYSLISTIQ